MTPRLFESRLRGTMRAAYRPNRWKSYKGFTKGEICLFYWFCGTFGWDICSTAEPETELVFARLDEQ
jgi:hypothetical protein